MPRRAERFQMLLTEEERLLLDQISAKQGRPAAEVLRSALLSVHQPAGAYASLRALESLIHRPPLSLEQQAQLRREAQRG
ncbi:MAG: hypothetical protein K1X75_05290 [Leptospirales bacterium]|nr:hypothetical protein [Leptospirales bacterium]